MSKRYYSCNRDSFNKSKISNSRGLQLVKIYIFNISIKKEDCRQPYWKEKFISGLPSLFSQWIFNKQSELIGKSLIPFEQITFGQLLSFIKKEGILLCNELKLQGRYSTDNAAKRKELGSFCEAFCLPKLEAPSVKKRRKTQISKKKPYTTRNSNYKKLSSKKTTPKQKKY